MNDQQEREQERKDAQEKMGALQVYGIGLHGRDPKSQAIKQATSKVPGGGGGHSATTKASKEATTLAFIPDFSEKELKSIEKFLRSYQRNLRFYQNDKQTYSDEMTLHTRESGGLRTKLKFFPKSPRFKDWLPTSTPQLVGEALGSAKKFMDVSKEVMENSKEALESSEVGNVISTLIDQAALPSVHEKKNPKLCVAGFLSDQLAATVAAMTGREVIYAIGSGDAAINFDDNGDIYIKAANDGGLSEVNPEGKITKLEDSHLYFPSTPEMDLLMEQEVSESLDGSLSSDEDLSQDGSKSTTSESSFSTNYESSSSVPTRYDEDSWATTTDIENDSPGSLSLDAIEIMGDCQDEMQEYEKHGGHAIVEHPTDKDTLVVLSDPLCTNEDQVWEELKTKLDDFPRHPEHKSILVMLGMTHQIAAEAAKYLGGEVVYAPGKKGVGVDLLEDGGIALSALDPKESFYKVEPKIGYREKLPRELTINAANDLSQDLEQASTNSVHSLLLGFDYGTGVSPSSAGYSQDSTIEDREAQLRELQKRNEEREAIIRRLGRTAKRSFSDSSDDGGEQEQQGQSSHDLGFFTIRSIASTSDDRPYKEEEIPPELPKLDKSKARPRTSGARL